MTAGFGTYILEARFDGTNWFDLTPYTWDVTWRRGRDYASQLTGRASPGSLHATLYDLNGVFNRFNAASPLYGFLDGGAKIIFRMTAPLAFTIWTGYVDALQPNLAVKALPSAQLTAIGPLGQIAGKKVSTREWNPAWNPGRFFGTGAALGLGLGAGGVQYADTILGLAGWAQADTTIDPGQFQLVMYYADQQDALSAARELEATEGGYLGESADGKIVFEDRAHRLSAPYTAAGSVWSDALSAPLSYSGLAQLDPRRDMYDEADATVTSWNPAIGSSVVVWASGEVGTANLFVDPGETIAIRADYPGPSAPTPTGDHIFAWFNPVSATDYITNTLANGSGTDNTANLTLVAGPSQFAKVMTWSLKNTGATRAYFTTLQARGYPKFKLGQVTVSAVNAASPANQSYPIPAPWLPDSRTAQAVVDAIVAQYAVPRPIISMAVNANYSDAQLLAATQLDVSNRITLTANRTTPGGTNLGVDQDFFVESVSGHVNRYGVCQMVFDLSPAGIADHWWLAEFLAVPWLIPEWINEPFPNGDRSWVDQFLLMGVS